MRYSAWLRAVIRVLSIPRRQTMGWVSISREATELPRSIYSSKDPTDFVGGES
ncbi:hypothetical protein WN48_01088 [Eufriesea mexicana]|nr:hypothetical protein WN48_01088 [Eufriesea mexicana]